jgi:hypothetical protein
MNSEIENLINMALADGEVTEKERAIVLRKAEALGLDKDEVEMILDGKIALFNKTTATTINNNSPIKAGNIVKCPSCGSSVNSFQTKCPDCSHEFRNLEASSSLQMLQQEFIKIETESRDNYFKKGMDKIIFPSGREMQKGSAQDELEIEGTIVERKIQLISSFPIPNTKEDLLEILAIGVSEAKKNLNFWDRVQQNKKKLKNAWLAKCEQIIIKSRFSMKDDKLTLEEIEFYAKQLGIK